MAQCDWHVFVISLADAAQRRAPLLEQLRNFGLNFSVVDAVDGRRGLSPEYLGQVDRDTAECRVGRPVSDRELACALSHQSVYRRIVEQGLPGAIILEDDAILTPLFRVFLDIGGPLASDLVQMDYLPVRVWAHRRRKLTDSIALVPVAENAALTTGYCISAGGAQFLLGVSTPLAGLADWPGDTTRLKAVVTVPRLVCHPPISAATSTIEAERSVLETRRKRATGRSRRFLSITYWRRWWVKRFATHLS